MTGGTALALSLAANAVTAALCWRAISEQRPHLPCGFRCVRDYLTGTQPKALAERGADVR